MGAELAHFVAQGGSVFALGGIDGCLEGRLVAKPMVNRRAVNAGLAGRGGNSLPCSKGGDDLGLGRRQGRWGNPGEIR